MITSQKINDFEQHLLHTGRSKVTAARSARALDQFRRWNDARNPRVVPSAGLSSLPALLAAWVSAGRDEGLGPGAIRQRLGWAKAYCKFAGVTDLGPLAEYKAPPVTDPEPHPLPGGIEDVRKMMNAVFVDDRQRIAIALCGLAGLRINEAVTLDASKVHRRRGLSGWTLEVLGKGGKIRYVPVSPELQAVLEKAPTQGKLVALSNSGARAAITRIAEALDVEGGRPSGVVGSHDLRATFATTVYERTKDILLVQKLLGHSSVATTQRYIGLGADTARLAVAF